MTYGRCFALVPLLTLKPHLPSHPSAQAIFSWCPKCNTCTAQVLALGDQSFTRSILSEVAHAFLLEDTSSSHRLGGNSAPYTEIC